MSSDPLISVVTVSFNQGEFIEQNIQSVLNQNYSNFEHIVVDAGSTDNTLEVLKRYPHLKWTSEPDRGQSHGLNKAFARAEGEIIAWLNSDDWYAPNVFREVAEKLQEYPVLLAKSQRVGRNGEPGEVIHNWARTHYDLLRHWVPYNWLAQTSVFFTRALLEEVRLAEGEYLDESLHFAMDYDLWVRMAAKYPFTKRSNTIASFFRVYEENKTGERPMVGQRENSRVFRRFTRQSLHAERSISILLPAEKVDEDLRNTLGSLETQHYYDMEIVLLNCAKTKEDRSALKNLVYDLSEESSTISYRFSSPPEGSTFIDALNYGLSVVRAPMLAIFQPGDLASQDFTIRANFLLHEDLGAAALPFDENPDLARRLWSDEENNPSLPGLISMPYLFPNMVIKTVALEEIGGFIDGNAPGYSFQRALLMLRWNAWRMRVADGLAMRPTTRDSSVEEEQFTTLQPYYVADIFAEAADLHNRQEVTENYRTIGVRPIWQEETIAAAREYVSGLPEGWKGLSRATDTDLLRKITETHPTFAPPWLFLASQLEKSGNTGEAEKLRAHYEIVVQAEKESGVPFRSLMVEE